MAFENRIFLAKGPKTPGPQPAGVGKGQIQECGVAPNCFSSTSSDEHYLKCPGCTVILCDSLLDIFAAIHSSSEVSM